MPTTLKRYDHYRGPESLGDVWTLRRGTLALRCTLATHRLGWELRLAASSSFSRSHVCRSETEVTEVSSQWRNEAIGQGWTDAA